MPGKPKPSRSASTSGVMTPRSSATIGSSPRAPRSASKKRRPGPLHPAAVDRGRRVPRHLPVRLEAAEVVEAHEVHEGEHGAEAVDPPRVAGAGERVPAVERVAPELAGGAEVVGRHAGLERRPAVGGEVEELGVGPDVGAVVGHEDRDVAHDADAALAGLPAHVRPLLEEEPLLELDLAHLAGELAPGPGERLRSRLTRAAVPGAPGRPAVGPLQRHEEGEVVRARPPGRRRRPRGPRGAPAPAFCSKAANALASSGRLNSMTGPKSTSRSGKAGARLEVRGGDEALVAQRGRGETSSGLPAKAEKHWYGESP